MIEAEKVLERSEDFDMFEDSVLSAEKFLLPSLELN